MYSRSTIESVPALIQHLEQRLEKSIDADSFRALHGRGKCYPGWDWLNVDVYSNVLIFVAYREETALLDALRRELCEGAATHFLQAYELHAIMIQHRSRAGGPFECIVGEIPMQSYAMRGNLRFALSYQQQNVGFFLDIEPARSWLESVCRGKSVLNMFAYTCTFSVVAAAAGASSIVNIDMSKKSIARGRENHKINRQVLEEVRFFAHDIFKSWGKIRKYGPYDIVIIDPPSFQRGSFVAHKDYVKVLAKMNTLVADGGEFLACLNAPEIHLDEFKRWVDIHCPDFALSQILCSHVDFPEMDEGRQLKMLVYKKQI